MFGFEKILLVLCCLAFVQSEKKFKGKQLPNYIIPCKISDPNLAKCAVLHGQQTIPSLLKGDPAFKLKPLVPFHLDKVDLVPNDKLSLYLKNVKLYGIDTVSIKDAHFNLNKNHIRIDLLAKSLKILADYSVKGQILVLPVQGNGPAALQFENCVFYYSFDYDLVKKSDGKRYITNLRPQVDYKVGSAHFKLDNLFNGNKELGDNINKVLNENSQEVLKEFGVVIKEVINAVGAEILKSYLYTIPFDEILLP